jgi:hypothetical protein
LQIEAARSIIARRFAGHRPARLSVCSLARTFPLPRCLAALAIVKELTSASEVGKTGGRSSLI